jgi:catechol 2,3-dioxygenase-like lactoylglutathione lyase family enzyme
MGDLPKLRFGHVGIEVSNLSKAKRFYDRFLLTIGFRRVRTSSPRWLAYRGGGVTLWLTESRPARVVRQPPRAPRTDEEDPISDHLAFQVRSGKQVVDLCRALERKGFRPIYPVEWQACQGGWWYVSTAWSDDDGIVIELYATPRRAGRARTTKKAGPSPPLWPARAPFENSKVERLG